MISLTCNNVTRNPSPESLSAAPAQTLNVTLPEVPPDFPKSEIPSSDRLFPEDTRFDREQFFNLCPEDDHGDFAIHTSF